MHRMRHFVVLTGLGLASTMLFAPRATAALLRPTATASYPDIAADVNGTIQYQYDTQTQQGAFHLTNTPFLLAGGPTYADEYSIEPNVTDGVRRQVLNATLDSQGNLVPGAGNSYELYGTVVANNQVYSGLLLQGTPVEFGSASYTNPLDGKKVDQFDFNIDINGGALAPYFGSQAYILLRPERNSTFTGSFTDDFSAAKATSNTRSYVSVHPFPPPIPEPATLAILLIGGGLGLAYRHRLPTRSRRQG